jgi:hypothetical protein
MALVLVVVAVFAGAAESGRRRFGGADSATDDGLESTGNVALSCGGGVEGGQARVARRLLKGN